MFFIPKIIDNPREEILKHAKSILINEGYQKLNMRKVAKSCDFAIGTIYNYFPTKKELVIQIMANYWEDYYRLVEEIGDAQADIYSKLKSIYDALEGFVNTFKGMWVGIHSGMISEYSKDGLKRRENFTEKLIIRLETILNNDFEATGRVNCSGLSAYEISKFVINNFIMMAQMKCYEYDSFRKILEKLL